MPEISVLIPYYNDEDFLRESIQSVLDQTYTDFELVLINHACTDSSHKIARSFEDGRIVHIDLPVNAGAGGGVILDTFLKVARGKFFKLFCADDVLYADYLEKCMEYMRENPNIDFCFTNEAYIDVKGKVLPSSFYEGRAKHIVESDDWNFAALSDYWHRDSSLPFASCFLRKECFCNVRIDFTMVMKFDVLIFLQMLLNDKNIGFIKEKLVSYRIHERQISSSANEEYVFSMSFFEYIECFRYFFETENVRALQRLLVRNDLSQIEDLRLELAKFLLTLPVVVSQITAYEWLHDYFQDEGHRTDERYTIAEFRNAYKHSDLARKCLCMGSLFDDIGIKGILRILMKKIVRKVFPQRKKLSHL